MITKYAVMRHASYSDGGNISNNGHLQIKRAVEKFDQFAKENGVTEIEIWHSPQLRAKNTAQIFSNQINVKSILSEREFLDCDNEIIQNNLPEGNEFFILMISHQPDIEHYLKKCFGVQQDVRNCDIFIKADIL